MLPSVHRSSLTGYSLGMPSLVDIFTGGRLASHDSISSLSSVTDPGARRTKLYKLTTKTVSIYLPVYYLSDHIK